jgi:hypothetical protein
LGGVDELFDEEADELKLLQDLLPPSAVGVQVFQQIGDPLIGGSALQTQDLVYLQLVCLVEPEAACGCIIRDVRRIKAVLE